MSKKRSSDFWSRRNCTPLPEKILATPMHLGVDTSGQKNWKWGLTCSASQLFLKFPNLVTAYGQPDVLHTLVYTVTWLFAVVSLHEFCWCAAGEHEEPRDGLVRYQVKPKSWLPNATQEDIFISSIDLSNSVLIPAMQCKITEIENVYRTGIIIFSGG